MRLAQNVEAPIIDLKQVQQGQGNSNPSLMRNNGYVTQEFETVQYQCHQGKSSQNTLLQQE